MELVLQRGIASPHSTPGILTGITGLTFYAQEPPPQPDPVYGGPVCIPAGRYQILMYPSAAFKAMVPLLQDVPGRTGVELHYGNFTRDPVTGQWLSEGCILCGDARLNAEEILETQDACINHIWPVIAAVVARGEEVWITVRDPA
jgi:hypothetical protein